MTPYGYREGNSPLHRVNAGIKLLGMLAVSFPAYGFSFAGIIASAVLICAGSITAGIRPWTLLRGSTPLLVMGLFIIILRILGWNEGPVFKPDGLAGGLREAFRIAVSFAAGSLLFSTTTTQELRAALGGAENRLRLFLGKEKAENPRISLAVALMLGFIPRFFEIWENTSLACDARFAKKGFFRIVILVPLTIERMLNLALQTAEALEARGL